MIVLDRFRPGRASPLDTPINVKQETHKSAEVDRARAQTARLTARLRMLKRLPYNHDGEGAAAPIPRSVDAALAFLPNIKTAMAYGVTLDDDGNAVVEFEDRATGSFADITFCADAHSVECYRRSVGRPSTAMCGVINSKEVLDFLREAGIIA
ncbi:hypothetical protein KZ810_03390 [Sphingomonas sp. RHCKR47]|nr:hypothetical protein [Sphingomonas citricola]